MATYSRLGTFILAADLTNDPFGKVHRGLTITGSRFDRHKLIRTFSDELMDAGLGARIEETGKSAALLSGSRGFGTTYQPMPGKPAHVACDYVPGRSLAQLIEKARKEQIPLGVDHALSVLQGVSQALTVMHSKGVVHGVLSSHSIWVSFEGATQILDAPYANLIQGLLPKCPALVKALEPYRPAPGVSALQQDFYALGAILFELLTFDRIPPKNQLASAIQTATLKAAQEDLAVPPEIQGLLRRLMMVDTPFDSAQAFAAELDRVLYDGDYSPTTFNMAFFMHTLFREENEQDTGAMKEDTAADYAALVSTDSGAHMDSFDTQKYVRWALIGGGTLAIILGALFYSNWSKNKANAELQARIEKMELDAKAAQSKLDEFNKEQARLAAERLALEDKSKKGQLTVEEKAKIEGLKKKEAELERGKAEAAKVAQLTQQNIQAMKQAVAAPAPETKQPEPPKPTPAPPTPTPTQTQQPPTMAAPPQLSQPPQVAQAQPPQVQAPSAQPSKASVDTAVEVTNDVKANMPPTARRMIQATNQTAKSWEVRLKVFVDATGKAQRVQIEQDSGSSFGFESEAERAALAANYKPATRDGKPTSGWITRTYSFKVPGRGNRIQ